MIAQLPRSKAAIVFATIVLLLLSAKVLFSGQAFPRWSSSESHDFQGPIPKNDLPCRNLRPVDDVVVVMRTGATEIQDKLPVHFNTTFKCYNDLLIFSDYEEDFFGYPVHDVLANIDQTWKDKNSDFEIYNRLKKGGRAALQPGELSGDASFEGSKSGKNYNPGWRLDKWKFLPMMRETLRLRPDKNWYVFLESDSYLVWSNLLQWLKRLDPSKDLYYGSENQIGPDIFAHGGSVFVMSRSAVKKAADIYARKEEEWHQWTSKHWAGDCMLGKALLEARVPLIWSWPMFQGGQPEKMDFGEEKPPNKKLWCTPAMSYHHFSPIELRRMWTFEQWWIKSRFDLAAEEGRKPWQSDRKDILHHRDVFRNFILPNITTDWREWNNLSPDLIIPNNNNYDACWHICEDSADCLQFSVGPQGCSISTKPVMLGQRWKDFRSYWVNDRIRRWMKDMDDCKGLDDWPVT